MEMKKPVIGVIPTRKSDDPSVLYVPENVTKAVERLGGEVFMIDYDKIKTYELIGMTVQLDGVIYAGGGDMDPRCYGQERIPECGEANPKRDDIELNMFPLIMTRQLPILGICRGMQSINVALGGTLTQDIPVKYGTNHRFSGSEEKFHHKLTVKPDNMLYETVQSTEILTNSYHHQAIDVLAPGLIPTAYSEEGFVEAFEAPKNMGHFIFAVQWHPESTQDDDEISLKIFKLFMDAVHRYMTVPCHHHD